MVGLRLGLLVWGEELAVGSGETTVWGYACVVAEVSSVHFVEGREIHRDAIDMGLWKMASQTIVGQLQERQSRRFVRKERG